MRRTPALLAATVCLLLLSGEVYGSFERTTNDYEPTRVSMKKGWGATKCIEFQEISTLYRERTFVPALVATCELRTHQCTTMRAVNGTHYYSFQGCIPQTRSSPICTELAYEAAKKHGAEYFYCWDVSYERLNVPYNVPLFGRECCCNGDFCNRLENVKTIDTMIPHDQLINPYARTLHMWYYNALQCVGIISMFAIVTFWCNTVYIILKPAKREDDSAWNAAPQARGQLREDIADDEDEEADAAEAEGQQETDNLLAAAEKSLKKKAQKKNKKNKNTSSKAESLPMEMATQEVSMDDLPADKTGQDEEKKPDVKPSKEVLPAPEKEKKEEKEEEEKKNDDEDEEDAPEKKKKGKEKEKPKAKEKEAAADGTQFKLGNAKRLHNGRVQYVSMLNENSDYDDDD